MPRMLLLLLSAFLSVAAAAAGRDAHFAQLAGPPPGMH